MKKVLLSVLILFAGLSRSQAEEVTAMEYCNQIYKTAKSVMSARQEGVELINLAPHMQEEFWKEMLISAYSSPKYSTDEYKQEAKVEFANQYYLECLVNYQ